MPATAAVRTLLRSAARPDDDEAAFAELVRRHGPLVLGVCRRVLGPSPDADDAFQNTFLALVRHAADLRTPAALPGWLHRTALRAAVKLKARTRPAVAPTEPTVSPDPLADLSWKEVRAMLDAELDALPDHLRGPLVLCYLDGRIRDDAAAVLGVSLSTLKRRIADGLERLNERLTRRGVAGVGLAAAALGGHGLTAQVPAALARQAVAAFHMPALAATGFAGWRLAATLVVLLGGLTTAGALLTTPSDPVKAPPVAAPEKAKTDLFGDPLPDGAVLRLGTVGFRTPHLRGVGFRKSGELVGVSEDPAITVWPADGSPKGTKTPLTETKQYSWRVALSADGRFAAVLQYRSGKGELVVWDVTGDKPTEYLTREFKDVYQLAFSTNGEWLAVNESSRGAKESLQICHLPKKDWAGYVVGSDHFESLSFTPDGKRLAVATSRDTVAIDTGEKNEVRRVATPRERPSFSAINPDGNTLAVLYSTWLFGDNPTVRLFAVESGEETAKFELPDRTTRWVGFSPDGRTVWTGGRNGLREWDPKANKLAREITGPGEHPAAFSPDGRWLASSNNSGVLRYDLKQGKVVRPELIEGGHTAAIMGVTLSPDGEVIATDAADGEVRLWDSTSGKRLGRVQSTWGNDQRVLFLDAKSFLAVAVDYITPVVYDATTGKELRRFDKPTEPVKQHTARDLRLSADGKTFTVYAESASSALKSYTVRWDVPTGKVVEQAEAAADWRRVAFNPATSSPDGRWAVQAGTAKNAETGESIPIVPARDTGMLPARFSADSRLVSVTRAPLVGKPDDTSRDGLVVFDLTARATLAELPTGRPLRHAVSPDGRTVAVCARMPEQEEVSLWELASGKKV